MWQETFMFTLAQAWGLVTLDHVDLQKALFKEWEPLQNIGLQVSFRKCPFHATCGKAFLFESSILSFLILSLHWKTWLWTLATQSFTSTMKEGKTWSGAKLSWLPKWRIWVGVPSLFFMGKWFYPRSRRPWLRDLVKCSANFLGALNIQVRQFPSMHTAARPEKREAALQWRRRS